MKAQNCLEELKAAKSFIIYNVDVGTVIDFDHKDTKTLNTMWHITNKLNQSFRWKPETSYQPNAGEIESCFNANTYISLQKEKTFVLAGQQNQTSLFLIDFNSKGFARISIWTQGGYKIIESDLKNDPKNKKRQIVLHDLTPESPFSWAILTIDQGTFDSERILIRTATTESDSIGSNGLNTQTGNRIIQQEQFDIYNQQKYLLLAQFTKDKHFYSFRQINGEGYMSVEQNSVTILPYQESKSDWLIIQNIISKDWHLMSQDKFLYLSSKVSTMTVDEPRIQSSQQSFKIQLEVAPVMKNTQNNNQEQQNPPNFINSFSCFLKCKGSGKYLDVIQGTDRSIEERIDESAPQSVFQIMTELSKPNSMRIFFQDSPIGAVKPSQTSAVQVLDKMKVNSKECQFLYDQKTQTLQSDTRILSIVGGKLFAMSLVQHSKSINPYSQFDLEQIQKQDNSQQQKTNIPQQVQEQPQMQVQQQYPNLNKNQERSYYLRAGGLLLTVDQSGFLKQISDSKQHPSQFTLQQVGQNKAKILFLNYPLAKLSSNEQKQRYIAVYQQTKNGADILSFSYDSKNYILPKDNNLFLQDQYVCWSDIAKDQIIVSLEPINQ